MVQCGPYHCYDCHASEIGPELSDWYYQDRKGNTIYLAGKREYYTWLRRGKGGKGRYNGPPILRHDHPFSEKELETGFYEPEKQSISPYANTVQGELVDHIEAKEAYNHGMLDEKQLNGGEK